ncbi:hypothetical protein Nepgr_021697 [Nepenthes gracilis]|uniref:Uncharacterized protein n=1 Tax=Nepenthes gracilis TaxID=150966 RepID=A0AAD3SZG4_NEPGR|nr:hypothetical protein Nepgr_021697 [Nepenthes gracilis]
MPIGSSTHLLFLNAELGPNDDGRSAALCVSAGLLLADVVHPIWRLVLEGMVDGSLCCVLSLDGRALGVVKLRIFGIPPFVEIFFAEFFLQCRFARGLWRGNDMPGLWIDVDVRSTQSVWLNLPDGAKRGYL